MIEFRNLTRRRVNTKIFRKLADKIFKNKFDVSLVFSPPSLMLDINKRYRHRNKPANTLAFLLENGPERWRGEIFLNAAEKNLPYLFVHSALHLLGFKHGKKNDAKKMEREELKILTRKN